MPALEFLLALDRDERRKAFSYIGYLESQGERLRRPISEYLGDKIYELRPKQIRILYAFFGERHAVVLHVFRKTTGPVPAHEKRLAQTRLIDFIERYEQGAIRFKEQPI